MHATLPGYTTVSHCLFQFEQCSFCNSDSPDLSPHILAIACELGRSRPHASNLQQTYQSQPFSNVRCDKDLGFCLDWRKVVSM